MYIFTDYVRSSTAVGIIDLKSWLGVRLVLFWKYFVWSTQVYRVGLKRLAEVILGKFVKPETYTKN